MASINGANLTLTTVGANVTVNVTYNAVFTQIERNLANLGLAFREQIRVRGVDGITSAVLHTFPLQTYPVTAGAGAQTIARNRSITVTRASLQEDVAAGDADEIRCQIEIIPVGMPVTVSANTDQEILLG